MRVTIDNLSYYNPSVLNLLLRGASLITKSISDLTISGNHVVYEPTSAEKTSLGSGAVFIQFKTGSMSTEIIKISDLDGAVDKPLALSFDQNPVGTVLCVSSNTTPSAYGTWSLIDKEFTSTRRSLDSAVSLNSTNASACTVKAVYSDHTISMYIQPTTLVALSDTAVQIGTFTPASFGVTAYGADVLNMVQLSDNGQALITWQLTTAGILQSTEAFTLSASGITASVAARQLSAFVMNVTIPYTYMLDSFCDRFYFERTA